MMNRLLGNDFHNWSIEVQFSYPIGNGNAEAQLARTKLQLSQAEVQLQNLELQVAHVGARRGRATSRPTSCAWRPPRPRAS